MYARPSSVKVASIELGPWQGSKVIFIYGRFSPTLGSAIETLFIIYNPESELQTHISMCNILLSELLKRSNTFDRISCCKNYISSCCAPQIVIQFKRKCHGCMHIDNASSLSVHYAVFSSIFLSGFGSRLEILEIKGSKFELQIQSLDSKQERVVG